MTLEFEIATVPDPGTRSTIAASVAQLDLDAKVRLLTGATAWKLHGLDEIGLRPIVLSDGPVGVRGTGEDGASVSRLFPSPSALAATWDTSAAARLGSLVAREARAHGVDVVLAPQINIQRTPVAGRHFECYSEDPLLTSMIGSALISAMQSGGVGAAVKHFVANDSETARTEYLARVDEQALREVYLAPFEHAVVTGGAWSVMSAYNRVDDGTEASPMSEHRHLVIDVLKSEWGFDGVVVSDWLAARRTVESALGGLDLVMPGPGGPWEDALVHAVRDGLVPEQIIDDKVARILRLARRTGALDSASPVFSSDVDDDRFLRDLAARSMVVLRRREESFPVDGATVQRVALIGPNAASAYVLGGGSSSVDPHHVVTPLDGLRTALPAAEVELFRGGDARRHAPVLDIPRISRDPRSELSGVRVSRLDGDGAELSSEVVTDWDGWARDLPDNVDRVVIDAVLRLDEPGEHCIEVGTLGRYSVDLDGERVASDDRVVHAEVILDSSVNSPDGVGGTVTVTAPRDIRMTATLGVIRAEGYGNSVRGELRHRRPGPTADDEIREAVAAAGRADLAVVIVGTNDEVESEGWDRTTLALPGRQDELVERVLEVAPDAVIVVNAGAPVLLPWLEQAHTVIWAWFPGQECGDALADVVLGVREAAGRLPWTLPADESDVPVPHALPDAEGVLRYSEGIHVGYRAWQRDGRVPAAAFGTGLGWTDWRYDDVDARRRADGGLTVDVTISNTGARTGTEVVQVYLEAPDRAPGDPDRPVRWLGGFATIEVEAQASATVAVTVPRRSLEVWDGGWTLPEGSYRVLVGRSIRDIRQDRAVDVHGAAGPVLIPSTRAGVPAG